MNIFYLDPNPQTAAEYHCDKHVVKMIVEYSQLLSTAHRILDGTEYVDKTANGRSIKRWRHPDENMEKNLCLACHVNHPSAIWTRSNVGHYLWLRDLLDCLVTEYKHRYSNKQHATELRIPYLVNAPKNIPKIPWQDPPPAMKHFPQCIVRGNSVESYRNYYIEAKRSFATWKYRPTPEWYRAKYMDANIQRILARETSDVRG